jgi:diguanylate cyclase (GGDEF)-like protein
MSIEMESSSPPKPDALPRSSLAPSAPSGQAPFVQANEIESLSAIEDTLKDMEQSSRHTDVLELAEKGLALCTPPGFDSHRLRFLLVKSWRYLRLLLLDSALQVLREADLLANRLSDRAATAEVLRQLALTHALSGDPELSEKSFLRSIDLFTEIGETSGLAEALGGLAVAYWRAERFDDAAEVFRKSIATALASGNWSCAIQSNANLANYFLSRQDYRSADEPLCMAETIFREQGVAPFAGWVIALANRAAYWELAGQPASARALYEQSIATCEAIGELVVRPHLEAGLAEMLFGRGEFEAAYRHQQKAYRLDMDCLRRARNLEIQTMRGSFELLQEQRERKLAEEHGRSMERLIRERTRELRQEIEVRRRAENAAHHLANHDPLTGLPNRRKFDALLDLALKDAAEKGEGVAVFFVDLDHFSLINDTSGHDVGDRILAEVAARFMAIPHAHESVCRFGGDEFAILVRGADQPEVVAARLKTVLGAFEEPFVVEPGERFISATIGMSRFPDHSREPRQLLRFADIAMYSAKQQGRRRFAEFNETLRGEIVLRADLERDANGALSQGHFRLVYQPKVSVPDGELVGLEALARWQHPRYGAIEPTRFIPLFEETGRIVEFGHWAIAAVCAQLERWRIEGVGLVRVAVNVSQKQLKDETFPAFLRDCLERHGVQPRDLEIEITESTLMTDTERVVETLGQLSALGIHISIDDFGTGYSSLSLLTKLPLHGLKIDRSIIHAMLEGTSESMIVETIIRMAQALGKAVTAEGVETSAQFAALAAQGCGFCQGSLFGMPLEVQDIRGLLAKRALVGTESLP